MKIDLFLCLFVLEYMKCYRCKNTDPKYFVLDHGVYYCRKCIAFSRLEADTPLAPVTLHTFFYTGTYHLKYELTPAQKKASSQVLTYLCAGKDVFLYAATGAGKTEITFESIRYYLSCGKKVGFAISRRQVVLEIRQRLEEAFANLHVIAVCQGYTTITDGDIIVCTMHQLYRYYQAFDLLIMDEVDAFPYVGNAVLEVIADGACKGQKLLLSATPDEKSLKQIAMHKMEQITLFERPHKHPLIIPKVIERPIGIQWILVVYYCFKWQPKQILLFVPTKQIAFFFYLFLSPIFSCSYVYSSKTDKDEIMQAFREGKFQVLICTTLLERGITVPRVQVIVYRADHIVFTSASLIQIFGRVGRSFQDPTGKGLCLCRSSTKSIKECIKQLSQMNQFAKSVKDPSN